MFRDAHFVPQKSKNPQNKLFGIQEVCLEMYETVEVFGLH